VKNSSEKKILFFTFISVAQTVLGPRHNSIVAVASADVAFTESKLFFLTAIVFGGDIRSLQLLYCYCDALPGAVAAVAPD
jgi:hypothetical protein